MARRRRGSSSSSSLLWLVLLAIPLVAVAAGYLLIDPNSFKPRIAAAARAATGRELALRGPITIAMSWTPTLRARDVGLANPPGFSRPELATLGEAEAQLALWPLLLGRIEISRLVLVNPDVMLETDDTGQGNWHLSRAPAEAASPSTVTTPEAAQASRFAVGSVRIEGGRLTWRDGRTGVSRVAELTTLEAIEKAEPQPSISATAALTLDGHAATVTAELGSFDRLLAPGSVADQSPPWPMQVVVRTEGTRLAAAGAIARPLEGRGYSFTLDASAPDLSPIATYTGLALPGLRDVSATAKVSDQTGAAVFTALALRSGPSDLRQDGRGPQIDRLALTTSGVDQPVHAELEGSIADTHLHAYADLGSLTAAVANTTGTPFPLDLTLEGEGATLSAKGTLASLAKLTGFDTAISLRVPDLPTLGRLAGRKLPRLRDLALDGRLSDLEGGLSQGIVLRGASITAPQADLAGDLVIGFTQPVSVQGQLTSKRIDLDALLAAVATPGDLPQAAPAASPPVPTAPAAPAKPAKLISETPFNFSGFDQRAGDLRLTVAELRWGGVTARDITTRWVLAQGKLTLDPFSGTLPTGAMSGRLVIDSHAGELPISLGLSAPGLALKPLLAALDWPDDVTGTVELQADLSGAGLTPHALASSLTGKIGLVMTEGELDNHLLGRFSDVIRVARLPNDILAGNLAGRTKIRCLAVRADLVRGVGTVTPFVLDTNRALIQGAGGINLTDETVAMRLRPMVRTPGIGVVVPVRVTGSFQQLNVTTDGGGALEAATIGLAGTVANGLVSLARNPFGTISNALTGERGGDACSPAINAARNARPGGK